MLAPRIGRHVYVRLFSTAQAQKGSEVEIFGTKFDADCATNVTQRIKTLSSRNLLGQRHHPLHITKEKILDELSWNSEGNRVPFKVYDCISPVVTVEENFDQLLIPEKHISRSFSDTYYINRHNLLRTHTSAHQVKVLSCETANTALAIVGDVYRRDEIDSTHYPVFHQFEGLRLLPLNQCSDWNHETAALGLKPDFRLPLDNVEIQLQHKSHMKVILDSALNLQVTLENMMINLFRHNNPKFGLGNLRWVSSAFPFTSPSWELEVFHCGRWMEILGCGIIMDKILSDAGKRQAVGWAFGLGIERIAMILFGIPDIRLFWSEDDRFLSQFNAGSICMYRPYSIYPATYQDLSFWINHGLFHPNDFYECVREIAGDLVEEVKLVCCLVLKY